MGLDNYAVIIDDFGDWKHAPNEPFKGITLCGGVMTSEGSNSSSFRGKVYNGYVREVTGISLYSEMIYPDKVKRMSRLLIEELESYWKDKPDDFERDGDCWLYPVSKDEASNLTKWFQIAAKNNYAIVAWQ